jgi:dCTP deaminase
MPNEKIPISEFAARLRHLDDRIGELSDAQIAARYLRRYPVYRSQVDDDPQAMSLSVTPSVLSGDEIRQRIVNEELFVAPILDWGSTGDADGQFGRSSLDVRLSSYFAVPRATAFSVVDPTGRLGESGESSRFDSVVRTGYAKPFVLHPGQFALAYTLEYFKFPADLMGYVIGRSSWGRLGLIIATATMVNPAFSGVITLELANVGNLPVVLYPGMRIAQLVIHGVERFPYLRSTETPSDSQNKYAGQLPGNRQRLYKDRDIPWVVPRTTVQLVGVVGATKSGKSVVAAFLAEQGFRHYSMSSIVREMARKRGYKDDIEVLQDLGDELRQQHGKDFLAREVAELIRKDKTEPQRVVITGFKHPAEVEYFKRDDRFRAIAIETTFDVCKHFKESESGKLSEEKLTEFVRQWNRDYESGREVGQHVKGCVVAAHHRIKNIPKIRGGAESITQEELRTRVTELLTIVTRNTA